MCAVRRSHTVVPVQEHALTRGPSGPASERANATIQNVHRTSGFEHPDARRLGRATGQPGARPDRNSRAANGGSTSAVQDKRRNSTPSSAGTASRTRSFPSTLAPSSTRARWPSSTPPFTMPSTASKPRYEPYTVALSSPGASLDAAVASAARDVMLALTPNQQPRIEQEYAAALADVPRWTRQRSGRAARSTGGPRQSRPTS